jgi:glycosyltransferase involved in cell wall biosynthesis
LLDDCSTDDSRSVLTRYANDERVRIVFNEQNSGSTFKQWNSGVSLARGKYVWIAESDDYADERLLGRLVAELERDERVVLAYCRSRCVEMNGYVGGFADGYLDEIAHGRWAADFCVDGRDECRTIFPLGNPIPNASAVVFRKTAYERAGGADETFKMCGDWKTWAAIAQSGKISYIAEPLNYYRQHAASIRYRSMDADCVLESLRVVRWLMDEVEPQTDAREKALNQLASVAVPLLMSNRVPAVTKREISDQLHTLDVRFWRRAILPALKTVGMKFRSYWHKNDSPTPVSASKAGV